MQSHQIQVQKTAHYYTYGSLNSKTKAIFFVFHGYGQLASKIIHKFDNFEEEEVFVVAPEGLSRFYFGGFTGKVGASWMTKADREQEIEDYCRYIQQVYDGYVNDFPEAARIHLLGFSQGGVTATRFLLLQKPQNIFSLILWGSDIPPDLDYKKNKAFLDAIQLHWIYGKQDQFLTEDRIVQLKKRFEQFGLAPKITTFEGKHEIDRPTLTSLKKSLTL